MKRLLLFAMAVIGLFLAGSSQLLAQTAEGDPFLGRWRLNLAQSKFMNMGSLDKPLIMTIEGQADARLVIVEGITTDEKNIAYSFLIDFGGSKKSRVEGTNMPNGEDTITANKTDDHTVEFTGTKEGKAVYSGHVVVSADGKTITITTQGTDPQGKPTSETSVWDKKVPALP
jgi:hypothetical protein